MHLVCKIGVEDKESYLVPSATGYSRGLPRRPASLRRVLRVYVADFTAVAGNPRYA